VKIVFSIIIVALFAAGIAIAVKLLSVDPDGFRYRPYADDMRFMRGFAFAAVAAFVLGTEITFLIDSIINKT
jgi:hypothetical protein